MTTKKVRKTPRKRKTPPKFEKGISSSFSIKSNIPIAEISLKVGRYLVVSGRATSKIGTHLACATIIKSSKPSAPLKDSEIIQPLTTLMINSSEPLIGLCYLLHFESKVCHAQHYLGYVKNQYKLENRLAVHRAGRGAVLTRVASQRGIPFSVVRVWVPGTQALERQLKQSKRGPRLCPICNPKLSKS